MDPTRLDPDLAAHVARRVALLDRVRAVLVATLDLRRAPDEIDPDTSLFGTGLALDSLDAVEIVLRLDVELGVQLDDRNRAALRTVNTLVDAILAQEDTRHGA